MTVVAARVLFVVHAIASVAGCTKPTFVGSDAGEDRAEAGPQGGANGGMDGGGEPAKDASFDPGMDASPGRSDGAAPANDAGDAGLDATTGPVVEACDRTHGCTDGHCNLRSGLCVACLFDAHCSAGDVCVGGECLPRVGCEIDADCAGASHGRIACDALQSRCVQCTEDLDCAEGTHCDRNLCVVGGRCNSSLDCSDSRVCNGVGHCVECAADTDCGENQRCAGFECRASCASDGQCEDGQLCTPLSVCGECRGDQDCPGDHFCDPLHRCTPDVCGAGEQACGQQVYDTGTFRQGDKVQTCNPRGDAFEDPHEGPTWCPPYSQYCERAETTAGCLPVACDPMFPTFCTSYETLITCSPRGKKVLAQKTCEDGTGCSSGECRTKICQPGEHSCQGSWSYYCDGSGTFWNSLENCTYGCTAGDCNPQP